MPYMHILECADGTYYTGSTTNLEKRLWEHQNLKGANHTRKKHPVKLVYYEEYSRIDEAFYREKQVQGWSHAKKKALIERNIQRLHFLAECKNESHTCIERSRNSGKITVTSAPLSDRSARLSDRENNSDRSKSEKNRSLSRIEKAPISDREHDLVRAKSGKNRSLSGVETTAPKLEVKE